MNAIERPHEKLLRETRERVAREFAEKKLAAPNGHAEAERAPLVDSALPVTKPADTELPIPMIDQAHALAAEGFHVFPLAPG